MFQTLLLFLLISVVTLIQSYLVVIFFESQIVLSKKNAYLIFGLFFGFIGLVVGIGFLFQYIFFTSHNDGTVAGPLFGAVFLAATTLLGASCNALLGLISAHFWRLKRQNLTNQMFLELIIGFLIFIAVRNGFV